MDTEKINPYVITVDGGTRDRITDFMAPEDFAYQLGCGRRREWFLDEIKFIPCSTKILKILGACYDGCSEFKRVFGDRTVYIDAYTIREAYRGGLDIDTFVGYILRAEDRKKYTRYNTPFSDRVRELFETKVLLAMGEIRQELIPDENYDLTYRLDDVWDSMSKGIGVIALLERLDLLGPTKKLPQTEPKDYEDDSGF